MTADGRTSIPLSLQDRGRKPQVREAALTANNRPPDTCTFPHARVGSKRISRPGDQAGFRRRTTADELAELIADQREDDLFGHRVLSVSVDAWPSGADTAQRRATVSDDRHGSLYCYVRLLCRCVKCRAASAAYARERRARSL